MIASASLMNNFSGGLKTEFTGLNFPENAATDTQNVVFSIIGDAVRREGIDVELNGNLAGIFEDNVAINSYKWTNVGGDGNTQILVVQVGDDLYFYLSSAATAASPLSDQILIGSSNVVGIATFQAIGNTNDVSQVECQFTDGNGYLFVFHPDLDPFSITYNPGVGFTATKVNMQIRDFAGIFEPGVLVNTRPSTLSIEHEYNLVNQGWVTGNPWSAKSSPTQTLNIGNISFTVATGIVGITVGQIVQIGGFVISGPHGVSGADGNLGNATVTGYNSGTGVLAVDIFQINQGLTGSTVNAWTFTPVSTGYINTFFTAEGLYPSNADIWYEFKDDTGVFNPAVTQPNVSIGSGQSPQGHFLLNPFNQTRSGLSGIFGLTDIVTTIRPKCGTWFQGRVWYAGVDASQQATGDAIYTTWTENIYFSQIVESPQDFGNCYQVNDPTDETLNALLPTDGGVIVIQGSGSIYSLFPIQNGVLVFAANGIWIIRGNQGLGFTADDYSVNKISSTQSISPTSIINVQGYPLFWNEEGIYYVQPSKEAAPYGFGGFNVEPLTVGTILSYYNNIPRDSKRFARGDYNPVTYITQWAFRSTQETGISNRYQFDTILNFNVYNKAFYPYTVGNNGVNYIADVIYMSYPSGTLPPIFKYLVTATPGTVLSDNTWAALSEPPLWGGTWNATTSSNIILSNGDLTATQGPTNGDLGTVESTNGWSSNQWYVEFSPSASFSSTFDTIYFRDYSIVSGVTVDGTGNVKVIGAFDSGIKVNLGSIAGQTVGIAVDATKALVWVSVNGGYWNNSSTAIPANSTGGYNFATSNNLGGGDNTAGDLFRFNVDANTNGSAVTAAFDGGFIYSDPFNAQTFVLSNNNHTSTQVTAGGGSDLSTLGYPSGRFYSEFYISNYGVDDEFAILDLENNSGVILFGNGEIGYGIIGNLTTWPQTVASFTSTTATIGVALDASSAMVWLRVNDGPWNGSSSADPLTGVDGIPILTRYSDPGGPNLVGDSLYFSYIAGFSSGFPGPAIALTINTFGPFLYPNPFGFLSNDGIIFAEERDDITWKDWNSMGPVDYTSYFVTGYNLHGKALKKWNSNYIQMFCRNDNPYAYTIQGIWDYANTGDSGRWSNIQTVTNFDPNYTMKYRRHKIRGQGMSLQLKVSSVSGQPFDIMGWSMWEDLRTGP